MTQFEFKVKHIFPSNWCFLLWYAELDWGVKCQELHNTTNISYSAEVRETLKEQFMRQKETDVLFEAYIFRLKKNTGKQEFWNEIFSKDSNFSHQSQ